MREKEIVIRLVLPRWPLRRWLVVCGVAVLGIAAGAYAALPTFGPGTILQSSDLLQLVYRSGPNGTYSSNAVYCGPTAATVGDLSALTVSGGVAGYAKAKKACESISGCGPAVHAHMCTAEEVNRSAQLGIALPNGWFSTFVEALGSTSNAVQDCNGWTQAGSGVFGAEANIGPVGPGYQNCNIPLPILCCD